MENALKMRSLISKLRPGDHIASERHGANYEHHGIYLGKIDGCHRVAHIKAPIKDLTGPVAKCDTCGYEVPQDGGRVTSCLDCFSRGERTYIIRYNVSIPYPQAGGDLTPGKVIRGYRNNQLYLELYIGGNLFGHIEVPTNENLEMDDQVYLSKHQSLRTPEQVIHAATSDDHYIGKYSFLNNNCEDFAVYCMIGTERSIQAEKKLQIFYRPGKAFHLIFNDRKKMYEKVKEKTLGLFSTSIPADKTLKIEE